MDTGTYKKQKHIQNILEAHMELYGYESQHVPLIQPASLFVARAGDKVIDTLFTIEKHGKQYALLPEFTSAAASRYSKEHTENVVRWQFANSIFAEANKTESTNYEKFSLGAELIGDGNANTDAEIIAMSAKGIEKVGIESYQIVLGNVGLQLALLKNFNLHPKTLRLILAQRSLLKGANSINQARDHIFSLLPVANNDLELVATSDNTEFNAHHILDVLLDSSQYGQTMGGRQRNEIAERLLEKHTRAQQHDQIINALEFLLIWSNLRGDLDTIMPQIDELITQFDPTNQARVLFDEWMMTIDLLSHYDIDKNRVIIQPDLTRNWEYYTGIVFGIDLGDDQFVAGGGRYDELTKLISNVTAPAVGFAYYGDILLNSARLNLQDNLCYTIDGNNPRYVAEWITFLRKHGQRVRPSDQSEIATIDIAEDNTAIFFEHVYKNPSELLSVLEANNE